MIDPRRYRPPVAKFDHDMGDEGTEETEWEDNALSNTMAWASATFVPGWCQTPTHWTQRLADYLWTTCPCCMIFRGIVIGFLLGLVTASIAWLALWVLATTRP